MRRTHAGLLWAGPSGRLSRWQGLPLCLARHLRFDWAPSRVTASYYTVSEPRVSRKKGADL